MERNEKLKLVKSLDNLYLDDKIDKVYLEYSDLLEKVKNDSFLIKNEKDPVYNYIINNVIIYGLNINENLAIIDFNKSILDGYKPVISEYNIEENKLIRTSKSRGKPKFDNIISTKLYYQDIKDRSYLEKGEN